MGTGPREVGKRAGEKVIIRVYLRIIFIIWKIQYQRQFMSSLLPSPFSR